MTHFMSLKLDVLQQTWLRRKCFYGAEVNCFYGAAMLLSKEFFISSGAPLVSPTHLSSRLVSKMLISWLAARLSSLLSRLIPRLVSRFGSRLADARLSARNSARIPSRLALSLVSSRPVSAKIFDEFRPKLSTRRVNKWWCDELTMTTWRVNNETVLLSEVGVSPHLKPASRISSDRVYDELTYDELTNGDAIGHF